LESNDFIRGKDDPQRFEFYISNPDLEFAEKFKWPGPRHTQGIVKYTLEAIFAKNYPQLPPCKIIEYGKPKKVTFDFAKKRVIKMAEE
jgi:ribonucleotide monophosphatase NagD (HAD superfamily)